MLPPGLLAAALDQAVEAVFAKRGMPLPPRDVGGAFLAGQQKSSRSGSQGRGGGEGHADDIDASSGSSVSSAGSNSTRDGDTGDSSSKDGSSEEGSSSGVAGSRSGAESKRSGGAVGIVPGALDREYHRRLGASAAFLAVAALALWRWQGRRRGPKGGPCEP